MRLMMAANGLVVNVPEPAMGIFLDMGLVLRDAQRRDARKKKS